MSQNHSRQYGPPIGLIKSIYKSPLRGLFGRVILMLTTTGRKSGLPRMTPLQYERIDGDYYLGSARGARADWFRNIQADPCVHVQVGAQEFDARAEAVTDPQRIADFLEVRLKRNPLMVGAILKSEGLPFRPARAQLEEYAKGLAMVILRRG
jgi:deazaflavin-dependent oxidoreductase (nitroreductase family)